jgi:hypothetical protein
VGADQLLHFGKEEVGRDGGGGVIGVGERYEGEGEVAFEGVGDADDAAFCDSAVGGDGLFYGACGNRVSFFRIGRTKFGNSPVLKRCAATISSDLDITET